MVAHHLVGCVEELRSSEHLLDELCLGRPGVIEFVGEPGIGKTRLLRELVARADGSGHLVLLGSAAMIGLAGLGLGMSAGPLRQGDASTWRVIWVFPAALGIHRRICRGWRVHDLLIRSRGGGRAWPRLVTTSDKHIKTLRQTRKKLGELTDRARSLDPADCVDPNRCQTISHLDIEDVTTHHTARDVHEAPASHRH